MEMGTHQYVQTYQAVRGGFQKPWTGASEIDEVNATHLTAGWVK